jgi:RNA polymerase sigma-70 factor, ECF subfamily
MDEQTIINRCKEGDKTAFPQLFSLYRHLIECAVFRIVRDREIGKDVVQEVLIRIYRNVHTFDGRCKISTWIYRIAVNESLRAAGKMGGVEWESDDILSAYPSDEPHALTGLIDQENRNMINTLLAELSPEYKTVITLHYFAGMSGEEIASTLKVPVGTINSRIARGRDSLREKIKKTMELCT